MKLNLEHKLPKRGIFQMELTRYVSCTEQYHTYTWKILHIYRQNNEGDKSNTSDLKH